MDKAQLEEIFAKYQLDNQSGKAFLEDCFSLLEKKQGLIDVAPLFDALKPTSETVDFLWASELSEEQNEEEELITPKSPSETVDFLWASELPEPEQAEEQTGEESLDEDWLTGELFSELQESAELEEIEEEEPIPRLGRYEDLGLLGAGGMGEVHKIKEPNLHRTLAMKILHEKLLRNRSVVERFIEEGQICAQLQHPNIVPIHEFGNLEDGRFYFTMKEIKGRAFDEAIQEVHTAVKDERWQIAESGLTFRNLIDYFHKSCLAIAYAHSKGVIHRDLKPENIMIGKYGEVLVVDWGIAKVLDKEERFEEPEDLIHTDRNAQGRFVTLYGQVAGTPAYMAPEQARGEVEKLDVRTDIYALGATLYEILSGRAPYIGKSGQHILHQVLSGPPQPVHTVFQDVNEAPNVEVYSSFQTPSLDDYHGPPLPLELIEACETAMEREQDQRYSTVEEFAQVLSDWLDGSKKREQALKVVEDALSLDIEREDLLEESKLLAQKAKEQLKEIPAWEGEKTKGEWWSKEAKAKQLSQKANLLETILEQKLQGALTHKPDLEEAHLELARRYRQVHRELEEEHANKISPRIKLRLQEHVYALPNSNPEKKEFLTYLRGIGAISLQTDVKDAEFFLEKYVPYLRRVILEPVGIIGQGELNQYPLKMGSYRLRIRKEGHHEVFYPFSITRGEHWDSLNAKGEFHPIHLPKLGTIGTDECYVPAGWFWAGGDKRTSNGLDRRRVWVNNFVVSKYTVTNQNYLDFLNDLVAQGRAEEALKWVTRERSGHADEPGAMIYGQNPDGRFKLVPDADGDLWHPDWPVLMIDAYCAQAYCRWRAEKTGKPFRLLHELEWEKAARGGDERIFPWGDEFDPSYACMNKSHANYSLPAVVDSFPVDESVYGVRGMAGNTRTWTASQWGQNWEDLKEVSELTDERMLCREDLLGQNISPQAGNHLIYSLKGGCWNVGELILRSAERWSGPDSIRMEDLSMRMGYSLNNKFDRHVL